MLHMYVIVDISVSWCNIKFASTDGSGDVIKKKLEKKVSSSVSRNSSEKYMT